MKYLRQDAEGTWQWEPYRHYLEGIRHQIPVHVADFALPIERYSLDSRESLHDSWLESLEVREPAKGTRHEERTTTITLRLLGAYHDRVHTLEYLGVVRYRLDASPVHRGHGDLITHEVRLDEGGILVHELLFEIGAVIEVGCADFKYTHRLLSENGASGLTRA